MPTEIRVEWNQVYATSQQILDLLFVANYDYGAIRAVHLKMAFGDAGREAAVADTEAALAAIDEWADTACGDFYSRWGELEQILQIDDQPDWYGLSRDIDRYESTLAIGDRLVPDEIAQYWATAATYQRGYFEFARSIEFDPANVPEGEAGEALFVEIVGVPWDDAREAVDGARERISDWVAANPGTATVISGSSGGPGSLAVRIMPKDDLTNRTLLLALLPSGTDFATVQGLDPYVAASCTEVNESPYEWEEWQAEAAPQAKEEGMNPKEFLLDQMGEHFSHPLRPIAAVLGEQNPCPSQETEPALVPGGAYELFVGAYVGDPGRYDLYLAAPEDCLQFPVTVDGDTVVDLPELEPCNLEPRGSPEEIARRTPPPVEAGGTLRVMVDSALQPEGFDYCNLSAVLLPAGTTLNDLGRGDAWPSGMFSLGRYDPGNVEEGDVARWAGSPGLVPILSMPPMGGGGMALQPDIRPDEPWDTRFPDPVPLASGSYDLRIEDWCENEGGEDDAEVRQRCAFLAVEVDGATIVEMPELGACP